MKRFPFLLALLLGGMLLTGANGCSSDPNVEGAKLDLNNRDYDRALENLATALERNPENADAYELKGQVLQEKAIAERDPEAHRALIEEMMESFNRAIELKPALKGDIDRRFSLAYYNEFTRAIQAFNRGQNDTEAFNEAELYFQLASIISPDSAGAYVNRAYALLNAGRSVEAIEPLESAIEKGDSDLQTFSLLANLYMVNERAAEAIPLLERATDLYPDDADMQAQLLNAYTMTGQTDRAMQSYQDAVANEPDNKLYRYNYGSLLLSAERYDEAIEQLAVAVELDSEYGNAQYNLGAAYVNKAVDVSERINEIDDNLREGRGSMSEDEISRLEGQIESMTEGRLHLFELAIPPLEKAKDLAEQTGDEQTAICQALFSSYVQTQQQEKAEAVAECAGYEDIN